MNNYKLYIQDLSGAWHLANMGDDKPAMNYQVNNIAELKDRQVDYSQSLKLPTTPNNCKIFGYSNEFDVESSIPYRKLNCRLFAGDSLIAGVGSVLTFDKVSTYFDVQILSGNVDFFELLQNAKVAELYLGYYTLGSNDFGYGTDDFIIPKVNLVEGQKTWTDSTIDRAVPFAWLKSAIEKICTQNGYILQTNLLESDWNTKALNVCSLKPSGGSFIPFHALGYASYYIAPNTPNALINFTIQTNGSGCLTLNGANFLQYIAPIDCTVKIKVHAELWAGYYMLNINGSPYWYDHITSNPKEREEIVTLSQGDIVTFHMASYIYNGVQAGESYLNITDMQSEENVPKGGILYIAPNIGFDTQFDLFKAFVQLYGMSVLVDNATKTVYCYTMQKIYDNKSLARDWSGKVTTNTPETTFSVNGYAQSNTIKFEDNTTDAITDKLTFTVDDAKLEKEKELFAIKFEAGKNYSQKYIQAPLTVAYIPLYTKEIDDEQNATYTFKGSKPHICHVDTAGMIARAEHVTMQSFASHYEKLINNMLVNAKIIEDEFLLTEQDIEDYKAVKDGVPGAFIPAYVEKYGAYFYINKIKNFVSGKPTKCELVRL